MSRTRTVRHGAVLVALLGALAALAAGCSRLARAPQGAAPPARPPLIVVSMDGFRWDYLDRGLTPNLLRLAAEGVRVRALVPAFPTMTFPNHWTMVTGLEPGHHGVVGNDFVDASTGAAFHSTDPAARRDARWWGGEPLWATAERQGVRAAALFWPGSEAPTQGVRPSRWRRYSAAVNDAARVDQVLAWLDLPPARRPSVLLFFLENTDDIGHPYGPDASLTRDAIARLDEMIGRLQEGLRRRGLAEQANLVVVSDHGMVGISTGRVVLLDDYLDPAVVEARTMGPLVALDVVAGFEDSVARALARLPNTRMYRREETPERWHYRAGPRIAAFVGVADEGWQVLTRARLELQPRAYIGGGHGYDPDLPAMRGILIATGPAFRRGVVLESLRNIHVYELLCRTAGLQPAPNDGSADSVHVFFAEP